MILRRAVMAIAAFCVLAAATPSSELSRMLDDAERVRETDKPKSRALLDQVNRALATDPDPLLVARAQLLECTWADEPAPAYRAVTAGLAAAERAGNQVLRAKLIVCRANALEYDSRPLEAERDYRAAADVAKAAGAEAVEADALTKLGEIQYTRGAMADALTNLQSAYRTNERLGLDMPRLDALMGIANVYADSKVGQYDRAIEYYKQLVVEYEKRGKPSDVADTLFNIGSTYEVKGDLTAAELHYRRALAAFERINKPADVAFTKRALGSSLMKRGRVREALALFDAALAYYESERDTHHVVWVRQFRGMAYRRLGRSAEALRELEAARRYYEAEKNTRFLDRNLEETSLVYAQLGQWDKAYEAAKRHTALQQELATARRDEVSSRLRVEFDAEKKEQENRALARENALRATALRAAERSQKLQFLVMVLTALLATALAVLFWRQVANTRRMRIMAMTDELTRLPNRRHILTAAEEGFAAAKKKGHALAIIAFDIDRFKRINDTLGHAAGDAVLRSVARTCRLTLRPTDLVGRTGGEEFLVVLNDTTQQQAADIAERLRAAVEKIDFSTIAPDLRVTISLGVARLAAQDSLTAMCNDADAVLYRAKETGRNRVEVAAA